MRRRSAPRTPVAEALEDASTLPPSMAAVALFLAVPLTFFATPVIAGTQPSGVAWLIGGSFVAAALIVVPLGRAEMVRALPYIAFVLLATASLTWAPTWTEGLPTLVQLTVPLLCYLLGWHVEWDDVRDRVVRISRYLIGVALVLVVVNEVMGSIPVLVLDTRPLGISLALLFIVATSDRPSFLRTSGFGLACIAVGFITGTRMAAAVVLVLVLASPALRVRLWMRIALVLAAVGLLIGLFEVAAVRERFFFEPEQATIEDAFRWNEQLNTAGRRELWPRLVARCGEAQPLGYGIGASTTLSFDLSDGGMAHPHNEYLRIWCDTGFLGAVPFWAFFAGVTIRLLRSAAAGRGDELLQRSAVQLVLALLLFSITDNPILYTGHFMGPALLVLGCAEAQGVRGASAGHREPASAPAP
jgi:O-antigen ligase